MYPPRATTSQRSTYAGNPSSAIIIRGLPGTFAPTYQESQREKTVGAACAFTMAWYHPDLYHRVLSYSGTFVNQQWPYNPETPHGAWDFHEKLIPNSPKKPLRIWMHVSDRDNLNTRDNYHDWVLANENMARVLEAKGYPYQFVFAKNAGHCDRNVKANTLPLALEYVWQGYTKK